MAQKDLFESVGSIDLEKRVDGLFPGVNLPIASKDILAYALAQTALKNMYIALGSRSIETISAGDFFPEELTGFFNGFSVSSFSPEELIRNARNFVEFRQNVVKQTRKNPQWFVDFMKNFPSFAVNRSGDETYENLDDHGKFHANVGTSVAYLMLPVIWRDISLALCGSGRYLIGFEPSGKPISRGMGEVLHNNAGFNETAINWQNLGAHAAIFFNLSKLEKLVQHGDLWSGPEIIGGYPHIADADMLADQYLRFGYDHRERFNPIIHEFPINQGKKSRYKAGESIASIRVIDLHYRDRGFEYVIRHTNGTIAVGRLRIPDETQIVTISASNFNQYLQESVGSVSIHPIHGLLLLIASFGRDMTVYDNREKEGRERAYDIQRQIHPHTEPVEIWLPQKKLHYNTNPRNAALEHERIDQLIAEFSPRYVPYHKRRLPEGQHASEKQLQLATNLPRPYPVPPGHTFVSPYWVGEPDENMVKQYKSKSAAGVLFSARAA